MVGLGSHANPMRERAPVKRIMKDKCDNVTKQWYTLVKLDEYGGIGHVVSDEELRELEELILSAPDRSEDDGSLASLSQDSDSQQGDSEEDPAQESEGTSLNTLRMPQMSGYQKPGGPCDHCGAVGACLRTTTTPRDPEKKSSTNTR